MAEKKPNVQPKDKAAAEQPHSPESELDTLRHIVFGAAKADIETRLSRLENKMMDTFAATEQTFSKNLQALQTSMENNFAKITEQLNSVDKHYDDKTAELHSYADKLSSELEMADTSSKQEMDNLYEKLEKEIADLTKRYNLKFDEASEKLEQVTKELSSSKTDRKTLAKLLATMAINLETDED